MNDEVQENLQRPDPSTMHGIAITSFLRGPKARYFKRQNKTNLINDDNIHIHNHIHFMEQVFNKPYPMLIKIQPGATVCRYLFTAKSLYMFRVSQHPSSGVLKTVTAASGTVIILVQLLPSVPIRPRWREVAVPIL